MTDYFVYLDDSGHPSDQPYVIVAGFVASESQWLAFEKPWAEQLAKHGLANPFHMTDFMCERMSALKRDHILTDLALLIRRHVEVGFAVGVDMEAYREVNGWYALEEAHGAPYALAARGFARKLHEWQQTKSPTADRLLIFVEEGTKHYGDLEQVFERDNIPYPRKVPKSLAAVQPADILGWETFNALRSNYFGKNIKRLGRKVMSFSLFKRHDLVDLCKHTNVPPRSRLAPNAHIAFHSNRKRPRRRTIK